MKTYHKILTTICITTFSYLPAAYAAPPFISDNPEPTEYGHIEFYLFSGLDKSSDAKNWQVPAIEADWGFAPDWQLHLVVPGTLNMPKEGVNTYGLGDIEAGFTYRFLREENGHPQIAIAPQFELATGDADRGLGNGRTWVKLPVWLQKTWGTWTAYGGGGYAMNSTENGRDFSFASLVLQHDLSEKWTLGSEVYAQDANTISGSGYTLINIGGNYNFNKKLSLLFSVGHTIGGEEHLVSYLGLHWAP